MSHVIIGTAGHIDHGKTALIKALTGIETDTLPEEQERGVTIDIGFGYWKDNVTIIDVPGHERFVKNMVTGVCTVDLALFVVAADDGPMPQTREHLGILNLLGVRRGIVALTKTDLVDEDWVELVADDLQGLMKGTFLEGAPVVPVSSITGEGIEALKGLLEAEVAKVEERPDRGVFRLPVDRVFSVRGFGTVVTGTVLSGSVQPQGEVVLQPTDRKVRVRGVQVHSEDVAEASVGTRAAINLSDVDVSDVQRGDLLTEPGYFSSTYMVDATLQLLPDAPAPVKNRDRVHLHLGPRDVLARVILLEEDEVHPGGSQLVQFRLEESGVAARGDRYVIRRYSPVQTLGGGIVLDPSPAKHKREQESVLEILRGLQEEEPSKVLEVRLKQGGLRLRSSTDLARDLGVPVSEIDRSLDGIVKQGVAIEVSQGSEPEYVHTETWEMLARAIEEALRSFHQADPLSPGIARNELRDRIRCMPEPELFNRAVDRLVESGMLKGKGSAISLPNHEIRLLPEQEALRGQILNLVRDGKGAPPDLTELGKEAGASSGDVSSVIGAMQAMGDLVRLQDNLVFDPGSLKEIEDRLVGYLRQSDRIGVSEFRDLVGTTRKYAVPLLNHFDRIGVTVRDGDYRVLK